MISCFGLGPGLRLRPLSYMGLSGANVLGNGGASEVTQGFPYHRDIRYRFCKMSFAKELVRTSLKTADSLYDLSARNGNLTNCGNDSAALCHRKSAPCLDLYLLRPINSCLSLSCQV